MAKSPSSSRLSHIYLLPNDVENFEVIINNIHKSFSCAVFLSLPQLLVAMLYDGIKCSSPTIRRRLSIR